MLWHGDIVSPVQYYKESTSLKIEPWLDFETGSYGQNDNILTTMSTCLD